MAPAVGVRRAASRVAWVFPIAVRHVSRTKTRQAINRARGSTVRGSRRWRANRFEIDAGFPSPRRTWPGSLWWGGSAKAERVAAALPPAPPLALGEEGLPRAPDVPPPPPIAFAVLVGSLLGGVVAVAGPPGPPSVPGAPSTPGVPTTVTSAACAGGRWAAKSKLNVSGPSVVNTDLSFIVHSPLVNRCARKMIHTKRRRQKRRATVAAHTARGPGLQVLALVEGLKCPACECDGLVIS
jgi:hypothetical protein